AAVAREAVRAQQHAGIARIPPLHVPHAVKPMGIQADHRSFAHRGHDGEEALDPPMNADERGKALLVIRSDDSMVTELLSKGLSAFIGVHRRIQSFLSASLD